MIYITYKKSFFENGLIVKNVWNVKCKNVEERYIEFIKIKAKEINVIINPYCLNSIDDKNIKRWNIDYFIKEVLKGKKLNHKNLYL